VGKPRSGQPSQQTITVKVTLRAYDYIVRVAEMLARENETKTTSIPSAIDYIVDQVTAAGLDPQGESK
jgi:hypothetical protein